MGWWDNAYTALTASLAVAGTVVAVANPVTLGGAAVWGAASFAAGACVGESSVRAVEKLKREHPDVHKAVFDTHVFGTFIASSAGFVACGAMFLAATTPVGLGVALALTLVCEVVALESGFIVAEKLDEGKRLKAEKAASEATHDARFKELSEKNAELKRNISTKAKEVDALRAAVVELTKQVDAFTDKNKALEEKVQTLTDERVLLEKQKAESTAEKATNEARRQALQKQLEKLSARGEVFAKERAEILSSLDRVMSMSEFGVVRNELSALRTRLSPSGSPGFFAGRSPAANESAGAGAGPEDQPESRAGYGH